MKYSKLVRDKIPEVIKKNGGAPIIHSADNAEYWEKLKEKLQEEMKEFSESETIEEMADILEVFDAIAEYKGFDGDEIRKVREKKAEERGKFKDRIILDAS